MLKLAMCLRVKWAMVVGAVSRTLTCLGALDPGTHRRYETTLPQYMENRAIPRTTPTLVLQYIPSNK